MAAPGGVKLHQDHVLGHHEVGEGVSTEHTNTVILYHQVVASWGLQWVDIRLQVSIILPAISTSVSEHKIMIILRNLLELRVSRPIIGTGPDQGSEPHQLDKSEYHPGPSQSSHF